MVLFLLELVLMVDFLNAAHHIFCFSFHFHSVVAECALQKKQVCMIIVLSIKTTSGCIVIIASLLSLQAWRL